MEEIKALISQSQQMVISSLTKELEEVKSALSSFVTRVTAIEDKINIIMSSNSSLSSEISFLKRKVDNLESTTIETCVSEFQSRLSRSENIIIQDVPEAISGTLLERQSHDEVFVNTIFCEIGVAPHDCQASTTCAVDFQRIGKKRKDGSRLLKVKVTTREKKLEILRKAKSLRTSDSFKQMFIRLDLTPMQLEEDKRLRQEVRERKLQGEDVLIVKGKVILRSDLQNFQ